MLRPKIFLTINANKIKRVNRSIHFFLFIEIEGQQKGPETPLKKEKKNDGTKIKK